MTGNEWHSRACSSQPEVPAAGTVECLLLLGSRPALCVMGTGDALSLGQLTLPGPYVLWELEVSFLWAN
ncbi:hypothetical protein CRV24_003023 [Beauveria bassiana]|nr:hypothetical protein CRV24_003023 [Beauveria bassiana]